MPLLICTDSGKSGWALAQNLSKFGPVLVQIWTSTCPHLDQFWSKFRQSLVQLWTKICPNLDQIWTKFCPNLVQIWSKKLSVFQFPAPRCAVPYLAWNHKIVVDFPWNSDGIPGPISNGPKTFVNGLHNFAFSAPRRAVLYLAWNQALFQKTWGPFIIWPGRLRGFWTPPKLVQLGPVLVQTGTTTGPNLDQFWSKFGQLLAQIWTKFGPNLDQIWTKLGPTLVQIWTKSGPNLVSQSAPTLPLPHFFYR